jgi:phytol kinase
MLNMFILSGLFLVLFSMGEIGFHALNIQGEFTRKFVHAGTGILTMLFPMMLDSHWYVLALCASFGLILQFSLKFNLLKSINAVNRVTNGSILYPIIVYLIFLFYTSQNGEKIFFYLPILTMAFCDPMAALIGKKYGVKKYQIGTDTKSYLGSCAFLLTSIPLTFACYWFTYQTIDFKLMNLTISVGITAMLAEALSSKGFDNFSIPASVAGILYMVL